MFEVVVVRKIRLSKSSSFESFSFCTLQYHCLSHLRSFLSFAFHSLCTSCNLMIFVPSSHKILLTTLIRTTVVSFSNFLTERWITIGDGGKFLLYSSFCHWRIFFELRGQLNQAERLAWPWWIQARWWHMLVCITWIVQCSWSGNTVHGIELQEVD